MHLERFEEDLHDTTTGLTYAALSGIRKQSIEDVERLFSEPIVKFQLSIAQKWLFNSLTRHDMDTHEETHVIQQ